MERLDPGPFYHRSLPHLQPPGATFFLTFRLSGSLPAEVLARLRAEANRVRTRHPAERDSPRTSEEQDRAWRRVFGRWDDELAQAGDVSWLSRPAIAQLVVESIQYWDGRRYDVLAYCVMPNHLHWVITPLSREGDAYYNLSQITHTLKGYTAHQANRHLARKGPFWQHESYDHLVRNNDELQRIVAYVLNNPVKAGLVGDWQLWPWSYSKFCL